MAIYDGSKQNAVGSILAGARGMVSEDNGNFSTMRSVVILILGWVAADIALTGGQLTWLHVALIAVAVFGKVGQKAFERPGQGVVNQKALEAMIATAVSRQMANGDHAGGRPAREI